jgi:ornithine decarboxylase
VTVAAVRDPFSRSGCFQHETPFFIFSRDTIAAKLSEFEECFPGAAIHYAMKASSEPEVLHTVLNAGGSFEVASVYELAMLRRIGVCADKIIYGTPVKPAEHIRAFFEYGVDRFVFDSTQELEKIAVCAPGSRAFVRARVDDSTSVFKFSEKFGADLDDVAPLLHLSKRLGLVPYGISFHVGSQASDPKAWANAIDRIRPCIQELAEGGIYIEMLNLGGGFPCRYASARSVPHLSEIAQHTLERIRSLPYQPALLLEPGRALVAEAGILVASVIGRVERKRSTWLFLDAGVYNALYEAVAFQGSTRYSIEVLKGRDADERLFSLAGPTGDSPDVIMRDVSLPANLDVGDRIAFRHAGAYSLAVASEFNGFPRPAVYFLEGLPKSRCSCPAFWGRQSAIARA